MSAIPYQRVAFLFGGMSAEHKPSVQMFEFLRQMMETAAPPFQIAAFYYLTTEGTVVLFDSVDQFRFDSGTCQIQNGLAMARHEFLSRLVGSQAFVFSLLQGREGEDGMLQGVVEFLDIPSNLGSIRSAYLSIDKWIFSGAATQQLKKDILPIDSVLLRRAFEPDELERAIRHFGNREFVIKPNRQGASVLLGISNRLRESELKGLAKTISDLGDQVLLQERIVGREVTCGCLKTNGHWQALDCIVLEPASGVMGRAEKSGMAPYKRRPLDAGALKTRIEKLSCALADQYDFHTQCRFDFIVNDAGDIYLLEANSKPGLLKSSLYVAMLNASGLNLYDLIRISMDNDNERREHHSVQRSCLDKVIRMNGHLATSSASVPH